MTQDRYSSVAIVLHWAIAVLLVANVGLAWYADTLEGAAKGAVMGLHKPLGIVILLLTAARVIWRLTHRPPPLSPALKPWERTLARIVHVGFYAVLLALPLSGWAMVSGGPRPIDMFGLFDWPKMGFLAGQPKLVGEVLGETHHLLAKAIVYGLVPLHILGALKHQFLDKDDTLGRMIPFLARRPGH